MTRKAEKRDIPAIMELLRQVEEIHAEGRPDIFVHGGTKYTSGDVEKIIGSPITPVFVYEKENAVLGYAFCVVNENGENGFLHKNKMLYIDDICVDEKQRGKHIGTEIFNYVQSYAAENGFDSITLNVWSFNSAAMSFYEKMGMTPLKTVMEKKIK